MTWQVEQYMWVPVLLAKVFAKCTAEPVMLAQFLVDHLFDLCPKQTNWLTLPNWVQCALGSLSGPFDGRHCLATGTLGLAALLVVDKSLV